MGKRRLQSAEGTELASDPRSLDFQSVALRKWVQPGTESAVCCCLLLLIWIWVWFGLVLQRDFPLTKTDLELPIDPRLAAHS